MTVLSGFQPRRGPIPPPGFLQHSFNTIFNLYVLKLQLIKWGEKFLSDLTSTIGEGSNV